MRQHQQFAVAVLRRLDADEALIGDLLEEYEHGRSWVWLWTQVAAAVTLSGHARRTRPHSTRLINLATTPRGSAIGGFGLLAVAVLITVVAPQTWWVLGIAVVGGVVLGALMIAVSRRRVARSASPKPERAFADPRLDRGRIIEQCRVGSATAARRAAGSD